MNPIIVWYPYGGTFLISGTFPEGGGVENTINLSGGLTELGKRKVSLYFQSSHIVLG